MGEKNIRSYLILPAKSRCMYYDVLLHIGGAPVRTCIDIDDRLLSAAMRASGCKTKRATVEEGLRLLVRNKAYVSISALRGTIHWEGDPGALRMDKRR
jgi:Arc/MetJ family transcription regulator